MVDVPHFAFPFTFNSAGKANVVDQDSDDDVSMCVEVLLATPTGSRVELPEYGIDDPTFATTLDLPSVLTSINDWEPRAQVTMEDSIESTDELLRVIKTNVVNGGAQQ